MTRDFIQESISLAEKKFAETMGRGNCKHGGTCVHCCPVCCVIKEETREHANGKYIMRTKYLGLRFEPKEDTMAVV